MSLSSPAMPVCRRVVDDDGEEPRESVSHRSEGFLARLCTNPEIRLNGATANSVDVGGTSAPRVDLDLRGVDVAAGVYDDGDILMDTPIDGRSTWTCAVPAGLHYNSWIAQRAVSFLERARPPFLLFVSSPDPHHPFTPPRPWADLFDAVRMPLPERVPGEFDKLAPLAAQRPGSEWIDNAAAAVEQGGMAATASVSDDSLRRAIALTRGMEAMIDDAFGKVLDALGRLGHAEDTVVVFTSDHGEFLGHHGLLHKGPPPFGDLNRVSMVMAGPGVPEAECHDALTCCIRLQRPHRPSWKCSGANSKANRSPPASPWSLRLPLGRDSAQHFARTWSVWPMVRRPDPAKIDVHAGRDLFARCAPPGLQTETALRVLRSLTDGNRSATPWDHPTDEGGRSAHPTRFLPRWPFTDSAHPGNHGLAERLPPTRSYSASRVLRSLLPERPRGHFEAKCGVGRDEFVPVRHGRRASRGGQV